MEGNGYSKPKVTVFIIEYSYSCFGLIKNILVSFQDSSEQISGKMIHASDSTIELYLLTLKTKKLHFLTNSSADLGFGHKILKTLDGRSIKSPAKHLLFFFQLTIFSNLKLLHTEIVSL